MLKDNTIPLHDLIISVSHITRIVDKSVFNHHKQVAYISYKLGRSSNYNEKRLHQLIIAALLHDVGMFSMKNKIELLEYENKHTRHADVGAYLLEKYPFFPGIAPIIRYHHLAWLNGKNPKYKGEIVPAESHLLHFADRISLLIEDDHNVLDQKELLKSLNPITRPRPKN